jgi:hypothetical protein
LIRSRSSSTWSWIRLIRGDDTSTSFCNLYGNGVYVTDVNIPSLVEKFSERILNSVEIEGVSAWILFAKDVRSKVEERYEDCEIRVVKISTNKQTRILAQSAFIKNHFYFLKEEHLSPEYKKFIKVLIPQMRDGSSKKDDRLDSPAMESSFFMCSRLDLL